MTAVGCEQDHVEGGGEQNGEIRRGVDQVRATAEQGGGRDISVWYLSTLVGTMHLWR
jgi:hypothetical protein